jgi:hypothetical protein
MEGLHRTRSDHLISHDSRPGSGLLHSWYQATKQVETAAGALVPVHEGLQRCVLVFSKQHNPQTPALTVMICHPANSKSITDQSMGLNWPPLRPPRTPPAVI